jgi:diacylglycerol kinase
MTLLKTYAPFITPIILCAIVLRDSLQVLPLQVTFLFLFTHFSIILLNTVIGSPVDVIKTRYMLSSGTNLLSLYNQIKASGYRTFYKG